MRIDDRPVPALTPHVLPPDVPMASWPAQLRIGIERLPQAAYTWDDVDETVTWDLTTGDTPGYLTPTVTGGGATAYTDPRGRTWSVTDRNAITPAVPGDPLYVYDAPFVGGGFTDALCDFHAVTIEAGVPDELGLFEAAKVELTLANPAGEYTAYTVDGRLVYFAPGRQICLWAELDGEDWWLANVRIDRWNPQADGTVVVEASDGFALLAPEQGVYTPGVAGEKALVRIQAVATLAGFADPVRGDPGDVTLTRQETDRAPLEEIQTVALSDGGIVFVDADGALVYRNRLWPAGRDDQTGLDVFSDNVCTVPAIVWDLEWTAADDRVSNWVRLVNVAGLTATATDPAALVRWPLTHPDPDQWTTQGEGDALAAALLAQRVTPRLAVEQFTLHTHDPQQDLWRPAIDRRLGDRIRFLSEQTEPGGGVSTLDIVAVVSTVRHEITPETWVTTVGTSRSVDYLTVEEWDRTRFGWDDADPENAWRY